MRAKCGNLEQIERLDECRNNSSLGFPQDDPLSSLDNEVAKYVFDHGIRRMLTRQKRTVVMVTQMLPLVYSADNVSICSTVLFFSYWVSLEWSI